jgi:hypothetical protein
VEKRTNTNALRAQHRHDHEKNGQQQPQDFAEAGLRRKQRALCGVEGKQNRQTACAHASKAASVKRQYLLVDHSGVN